MPASEGGGGRTLAEAVGAAMYERDAAVQALGITLEELRPGYARMRMAVRADMTNLHGTCHGGMIYSLADSCFGYCGNARNRASVAQHGSITYIAAARPGDVLTAECREVSLAGRNGIYDVAVTDQDGRAVAQFRGLSRTLQGQVVPGLEESS